MKLLKIKDNKGFYVIGTKELSIQKIDSDDLLKLIELACSDTETEIDPIIEGNQLSNPIEKIIYEEIYNFIEEIKNHKEKYKEEIEVKFDELEKKYL